MLDFKRFLSETDFEKIKGLVSGLEEKIEWPEVPGVVERIEKLNLNLNSAGFDRWGLHPETIKKCAPILHWLYTKYFRVETNGIERIPEGPVMYIGNHGGQIPLDALMAGVALFFEADPPRLPRAMIERWVPSVPFVSSLFTRMGAMVGDPSNCRELLRHGQSVIVFPEGVRGSGKLFKDRYQLQRFGTGFMRLALEEKVPIVPLALIGTEETYPGVGNFMGLAKMVGAPYFPITPFFPFLGPLGMIPLPTKITVRVAEPLYFEGDEFESEELIRIKVQKVKDRLAEELKIGLEARGDSIFVKAAK